MPSTACIPGKKAVFLHAFNCSNIQWLHEIVTMLSMAEHGIIPALLTNHLCQFSNQPVPRCSFAAFKLKAERVRESTQKKAEKKSESKHIQKVHAEPDFFHCGVSNIHHSKFKPDFQELMPQWFLL